MHTDESRHIRHEAVVCAGRPRRGWPQILRYLLSVWLVVTMGGGSSLLLGGTVATRPAERMGDPWGMIYGGSGWWEQDRKPDLAERTAEGAREYRKWGVQSSRVGICWCEVEQTRGTYDWSRPDAVIPSVAEAGIHIVLCVATTPRWAWCHPEAEAILIQRKQGNLAGCLPAKAEYWPDYERYLSEVVKRYGKYVKHYEIWNEPDGMSGFRFATDAGGKFAGFQHGGDPVWYAELVRRSHRVIKAVDPQARVGIGSYEMKKGMPPFPVDGSLSEALNRGGVSEPLRDAFGQQKDAPLSLSARVGALKPGESWVINDEQNGRRYSVVKEGGGLKVCDDKTWFIERLYEQGIKNSYDAMSIHPYGNPFSREWLATVRRVMVEHGEANKPLWVNEYSLHGKGVGLAFNTRRQLRLLRETPWISVAQPLTFATHFDPEISPNGRSLAAHRAMAEEYAPRAEFTADFEGPLLKILDRWEWDATGAGKFDVDGPELRQEYPHAGERCLRASTPDKMIRLWFAPYVKGPHRRFSGYVLIEPGEPDAKLSMAVGVESGDITQPIREVRPFGSDMVTGRWFGFDFPIDERFSDWRDLTVVTTYLEIDSDKPGLAVSIDDVRVGTGEGRVSAR